MTKSTAPTADDGTFMTIACLVMKLNCNPTWDEVHQAEKILREKGGREDHLMDLDKLFFQQHPERNYRIRHIELDEIEDRLGDLWESEVLPPGKRYFAVVQRGRHDAHGALFHVDDVDAPADRDEETCREIFVGYFPDQQASCFDCGVDTMPSDGPSEFYGVHDDIWASAGMHDTADRASSGEYLCIGCLETRLGRTLIARDFDDAGINRISDSNTPRLNDRMTREPEKVDNDQVKAARLIARLKRYYACLSANAARVTAEKTSLRVVLAYDRQTMEAMLDDMAKLAAIGDRKMVAFCWSETGEAE